MPIPSQTFTIQKGVKETITIQMRPAESVDGWNLEFRAKSAPVNPESRAQTYLTAAIDDDAEALTVSTTVNFPLQGPFKIRVDDEIMQVTDGVEFYSTGTISTTWAVERAIWGTTAASHAIRARITLWHTPQMLLDNGSHGGVSVEDADTGVIQILFAASFTNERPVGTYWWNLWRTDADDERPIAEGVLYLIPSVTSAFEEPPLHNN